jgi:hypothetical protein
MAGNMTQTSNPPPAGFLLPCSGRQGPLYLAEGKAVAFFGNLRAISSFFTALRKIAVERPSP